MYKRQLVHKPLQGHGAVPAGGPQGDKSVHGPFEMRFIYGKSQISIVQTQFLERSVVHSGGYAVGNGISQQTGKFRSASYLKFCLLYTSSAGPESRAKAQEGCGTRMNRTALHAVSLDFCQPFTGEPIHIEAPIPKDIARFMADVLE